MRVAAMSSKIVQGAKELRSLLKGDRRSAVVHKVYVPDVATIRANLGLTEEDFAQRFR